MIRTWHVEATVIALALATTVILSGGTATEWLGAAAVFLSSRHMSVADRLRECEESRATVEVDCFAWLDRYWIAKEVLWIAYFVLLSAWSALVGAVLFLGYPYWRRWYRRRKPLRRRA